MKDFHNSIISVPRNSIQSGRAYLSKLAFTLVELIATVTIAAILAVAAVVYIGGYITSARQTSDKQTLAILNDALNRYKCQGGDLNALTIGAPVRNVLAKLQAYKNLNGLIHSFLRKGETYPARSLSAIGTGKNYQFTRFNNYDAIACGASSPPVSFGAGVAYMSNGGVQNYIISVEIDGQDWGRTLAVKDASGTISYRSAGPNTIPASNYITFWACVGNENPAPSGAITFLSCPNIQLTSLNVQGLSSLTWLGCNNNKLTSLNLAGAGQLVSLTCSGNLLTTLDVSPCPLITSLSCTNNPILSFTVDGLTAMTALGCANWTQLTSLTVRNCPLLATISSYADGNLTSLSVSNCPSLTTINSYSTSLASVTLSNCPSLSSVIVKWSNLGAAALNNIYTALPDRQSTTAGSVQVDSNPGVGTDDTSGLAIKNWTVTGS